MLAPKKRDMLVLFLPMRQPCLIGDMICFGSNFITYFTYSRWADVSAIVSLLEIWQFGSLWDYATGIQLCRRYGLDFGGHFE